MIVHNIIKKIPKYKYSNIEENIMLYLKLRDKNKFRIGISSFIGICGISYIYTDNINNYFGKESAKVAKIAFNDDKFKIALSNLANDPMVVKQLKDVIIKILLEEEVQKQINLVLKNSVNEIIKDEKIKEETHKSLKEIIWKSIKIW